MAVVDYCEKIQFIQSRYDNLINPIQTVEAKGGINNKYRNLN